MKEFFSRIWSVVLHWAKAEIAFLVPLLSEYLFGALSRLAEASAGEQALYMVVYALLVWLTPNKEPTNA